MDAVWLRAVSIIVVTVVLMQGCRLPAFATQDAGGHPLIERFRDSEILRYDLRPFGEYLLVTRGIGPVPANTGPQPAGIRLQGMITRIIYRAPLDASLQAVQQAYWQALQRNGFEAVFRCSDDACGGRAFNQMVAQRELRFTDAHREQRYLAARQRSTDGVTYAMVYTLRNGNAERPAGSRIYTQVDVIEPLPANPIDDSPQE